MYCWLEVQVECNLLVSVILLYIQYTYMESSIHVGCFSLIPDK